MDSMEQYFNVHIAKHIVKNNLKLRHDEESGRCVEYPQEEKIIYANTRKPRWKPYQMTEAEKKQLPDKD